MSNIRNFPGAEEESASKKVNRTIRRRNFTRIYRILILILVAASIAYIVFMCVRSWKIAKNAKDMGVSMYTETFMKIKTKISSAFTSLMGKLGSADSAEDARSNAAKSAGDKLGSSGSGDGGETKLNVGDGKIKITNKKDEPIPITETDDHSGVYQPTDVLDEDDSDSGYVVGDEDAQEDSGATMKPDDSDKPDEPKGEDDKD